MAPTVPTVKLSNGVDFPLFGLGTWQVKKILLTFQVQKQLVASQYSQFCLNFFVEKIEKNCTDPLMFFLKISKQKQGKNLKHFWYFPLLNRTPICSAVFHFIYFRLKILPSSKTHQKLQQMLDIVTLTLPNFIPMSILQENFWTRRSKAAN